MDAGARDAGQVVSDASDAGANERDSAPVDGGAGSGGSGGNGGSGGSSGGSGGRKCDRAASFVEDRSSAGTHPELDAIAAAAGTAVVVPDTVEQLAADLRALAEGLACDPP